jgi:hypothetical protein
MHHQTDSIIKELVSVLEGEPWYGQRAEEILGAVNVSTVYKRPAAHVHSQIELLYHMVTWAEHVRDLVDKNAIADPDGFEMKNWRLIEPSEHTWERGLREFKTLHQQIITLLGNKNDDFLASPVSSRSFDFRFLLQGLIQHDIYHLGQIAYLNKLLIP